MTQDTTLLRRARCGGLAVSAWMPPHDSPHTIGLPANARVFVSYAPGGYPEYSRCGYNEGRPLGIVTTDGREVVSIEQASEVTP